MLRKLLGLFVCAAIVSALTVAQTAPLFEGGLFAGEDGGKPPAGDDDNDDGGGGRPEEAATTSTPDISSCRRSTRASGRRSARARTATYG